MQWPFHQKHTFKDMLVLRVVSSRFRRIVNNYSEFWYRDDLDISSYLPRDTNDDCWALRQTQWLRILLCDQVLVQFLGYKEGWTFPTLVGFLSVCDRVPRIQQNARRIDLHFIDSGICIALYKLASFQYIQKLRVELHHEVISLDMISESCPLLEELELCDLEAFEGNLSGHTHLNRLSISFFKYNRRLTSSLVPFNSTKTLTSLCLLRCNSVSRRNLNENPLNYFINLTHLEVSPLCQDLCSLLCTATNIKLIRFIATFDSRWGGEPTVDKVIAVFCSSCLEQLEELEIKVDAETNELNDYFSQYSPILRVVRSQLRTLQTAKFDMGLDISWCSYLGTLLNLKSLQWLIHIQFCNVETVREENLYLNEGLEKDKLKRTFEDVFVNFLIKPFISIDFW